ncbi:MAG: PAS domain S-box protein [Gaiellaceae bacterium]
MPTAVSRDLVQISLLGEALEAGPVAVFLASDDGRYLAVNAYACELLGYERDELLELRVTDVAVNEEAGEEFGALRRSTTSTGSTTLRRKDGTELSMHYRAGTTTVAGMALYIGICWPVES